MQQIAEPATGAERPQKVVIAQPGIISWAADTLSGAGTTIGATLLFVVFLLSSGDLFLQKIVRAVPSLQRQEAIPRGSSTTSNRKYRAIC